MDIVLRATIMFALVFGLLRLLGKRELGQLAPFELVTLVVIGDLIQQGVTHNDFSITGAVLAIGTFAFWTVAMGWIAYFSPNAEKFMTGEPRVIVRDGQILRQNMRRERMTVMELESEMRLAGLSQISQVAWAILEPNGKISFIAADKRNAMQQDKAEAS